MKTVRVTVYIPTHDTARRSSNQECIRTLCMHASYKSADVLKPPMMMKSARHGRRPTWLVVVVVVMHGGTDLEVTMYDSRVQVLKALGHLDCDVKHLHTYAHARIHT
jgi:hypothetical protein